MAGEPETIHATAIALSNRAALICGPSGSGKSDLAFRCLMQPGSSLVKHQAVLISDDRVIIEKQGNQILARPPDRIAGLLEIRGLGIYRLPFVSSAPVSLVVKLVDRDKIIRLPDPADTTAVLNVACPVINISAFEDSAAQKLLIALSDVERLKV